MKRSKLYGSILLASAAMGALATLSTPVMAQNSEEAALEEVLVTARRREEKLQEVPISMTIFNQEQIDDRNIASAADLAVFTPSMSANTRFGSDFASFSIRGFHQELRTTASVGVYFAEVVAPRGGNTSTSGDGAGPGDLFDLENVQVLKGPQGTLFGRNTTGGAVLLSPKKPTDDLEGYLEASAGNYDMQRVQGVLNVPISDKVRARFGFDTQQRDGYIDNLTDIGPEEFADLDYTAFRASIVVDITDTLENYTILKIVDSENNGTPGQTFACNSEPEGLGFFFAAPCQAMLDSHPDAAKYYHTFNSIPNPTNELEQWQAINTTTWQFSENVTIKNILSMSHLETVNRSSVFGTNLPFSLFDGSGNTQELIFAQTGSSPDFPTTSQEAFTEEIQIQGTHMDSRLNWQAGLYYEKSEPDGLAGARSPGYLSCIPETTYGDPADFRCNDLLGMFIGPAVTSPPVPEWGLIGAAPYGITYESKAVYAEGTYDFSDQWSVSAGVRYTSDEADGRIENTIYRFPSNPITGGYFPVSRIQTETLEASKKSEEPTWLIGVDYKPNDNVMLYGKYTRGYRQGGLNIAAPEGLQTYEPEQVDTYEIGAKSSFEGRFPGTFNIALFYNDFTDQAIQVGLLPAGKAGTTAIDNIGESTIQGLEIDANVRLSDDLMVTMAYAYLDTEVEDFLDPADNPRYDAFREAGGTVSSANAFRGEPLPFAPENSMTLSADYRLPLDPALGDIHAVVSYAYTDEIQVTSPTSSPFGILPAYEIFNFNLNWSSVAGSPFDVSMFATNLKDEKYTTFVSGNWSSVGLENRYVGQPRMYGMRIRYNF